MSGTTMGRKGVVWKTPDFTADGLKLFACIAMFLQSVGVVIVAQGMIHLGQYTQEELSLALAEDSHLMTLAGISSGLELVGGLAVPIFAFLLVEGFRNTSSYSRYLLTMVIFALLSEIPYDLAMQQTWIDFSSQNALVSMSICLLMLYFLKLVQEKCGTMASVLQLLIVLAAVIWAALFRAAYGLCLILLVTIFYVFYGKNGIKTLLGVVVSLLYVTGPLAFYGIYCYNGQRRNRIPKYVYYVFYPLHLLVLGLIVKYLMA